MYVTQRSITMNNTACGNSNIRMDLANAGRHAESHADAMRLSIFARLMCLRTEAQRSDPPGGDGSAERRMGALQKWRFKRLVKYIDRHFACMITVPVRSMPSKTASITL